MNARKLLVDWFERWTTFLSEGNRDRVLPMWMAVAFSVLVFAVLYWALVS